MCLLSQLFTCIHSLRPMLSNVACTHAWLRINVIMYAMYVNVRLLRLTIGHLNTLSASISKSVRACSMTKLINMTMLLDIERYLIESFYYVHTHILDFCYLSSPRDLKWSWYVIMYSVLRYTMWCPKCLRLYEPYRFIYFGKENIVAMWLIVSNSSNVTLRCLVESSDVLGLSGWTCSMCMFNPMYRVF